MRFIDSKKMKIELSKEQLEQLSSQEKIARVIKEKDVLAFDIYDEEKIIGFVMLKKYHSGCFLWDYAIDYKYQNRGYGYKCLIELIDLLKEQYHIEEITTTYKWGNEPAKYIYNKAGFIEVSVVEEDSVHEVNMLKKL